MSTIKFTVIGSGNVAFHLGPRLMELGCSCNAVVSRNPSTAAQLAQQLHAPIKTIELIDQSSDLILICVPDHEIKNVIASLPSAALQQHVVHTSGNETLDVYGNAKGKFINLYPLQSFSKNLNVDWSQIPVFYESNHDLNPELYNLFCRVGNRLIVFNPNIRKYLHLSAVFTNNFVNLNYLAAFSILNQCELDNTVLSALANYTTTKAFLLGAKQAQTGPAKRNDLNTIQKHLTCLESEFPEFVELYKTQTELIQKLFIS